MANVIRPKQPSNSPCVPRPHARPEFNNDRADWLGKLILDLKPDVVINIGDMYDFPSLASYDKGKKSFWGKTYLDDLNAGLDFDERMWGPIREQRRRDLTQSFVKGTMRTGSRRPSILSQSWTALSRSSSLILTGTTMRSLSIRVTRRALWKLMAFIMLITSFLGVLGRPIGGEHQAYSLISKEYVSCTCGHSHTNRLL